MVCLWRVPRALVVAAGLTLAFAGAANAATITVTTTSDETAVDGQVSLREAVMSVNGAADLNADVTANRTGSYGTNDTISVPPNASHYMVTTGELAASKTVTLTGSGSPTPIIDGNLSNRILHSTVASNGSLTVAGLEFTRGNFTAGAVNTQGGGAIQVDAGTLNVSNSIFAANSVTIGPGSGGGGGGGAIWSGGNATLSNTSFSGNSATVDAGNVNGGGAVYVSNLHNVSLTGDQFSGDSFTQTKGSANEGGGGLYNEGGATTLTGTSFSGETVTVAENGGNSGGGAIYDEGGGTTATMSSLVGNTLTVNPAVNVDGGGALYADGGAGDNVTLTATTIGRNTVNLSPSGTVNSGGGGIFSGGGPVSMVNSTLSDNSLSVSGGGQSSDGGGALLNYGNATFTNDTIAGNSANVRGGGLFVTGGPTQTLKNTTVALNTASPGTNCSGSMFMSTGNNIEDANTCNLTAGSDQKNTNPLIGPLQNNGGPTLTRAPLAGSPAIDHGDNAACPPTDQRGVSRPQPPGGKCDVGAVEYVAPASTPAAAGGGQTPAGGGLAGAKLASGLTLTSIEVHPQHPDACAAELNGRAVLSRVKCKRLFVDVAGTIAQGATGTLDVSMTSRFGHRKHSKHALASALRTQRSAAGASFANGRWHARLLVPGRNREPGDRWRIAAIFAGDAGHLPATVTCRVRLEAEGPRQGPSERRLSRHPRLQGCSQ
jgi:hypothetical protein